MLLNHKAKQREKEIEMKKQKIKRMVLMGATAMVLMSTAAAPAIAAPSVDLRCIPYYPGCSFIKG